MVATPVVVRFLLVSLVLHVPFALGQEEEPRPEPEPVPVVRPTKAKSFTSTRLRTQPHWPLASIEVSALLTGRVNVFLGVDLVAGVPLGWPTKQHRRERIASGWVVMPLVEASLGGLSGPLCEEARACGDRFIVGPGLKFGHGVGVEREGGVVRPVRMVYLQVAVLGGIVDVVSAPLAPANAWFEGLVRVRLGAHLGVLDQSEDGGFLSIFSLNVAAAAEYVAISQFTRGFGFGGLVGVAF
jgi:hypothetical protein